MTQQLDNKPGGGQLRSSLQNLAGTFAHRATAKASDRLSGTTQRLTEYAENGGGSGLMAAATGSEKLLNGDSPVKSALAGGLAGAKEKVKEKLQDVTSAISGKNKGGGKGLKVTNIVEQIDVGVPVDLAYRQWTQFADYPKFMKKVEHVEQVEDEKLTWKAQVFLSHRTWESTITEQVPNERIVWRSKGDKGYVDGAITFHELAPKLTRVIVVLEYHPQGLFERTGNLWRAQGRRVRLELKHFQRHVMAHAVLNAEEIHGWPGEIRDGQVVSDGADESGDQTDDDATQDGDEAEDSPPPKRRRTAGRSRDGSRSASTTRRSAAPRGSRT